VIRGQALTEAIAKEEAGVTEQEAFAAEHNREKKAS